MHIHSTGRLISLLFPSLVSWAGFCCCNSFWGRVIKQAGSLQFGNLWLCAQYFTVPALSADSMTQGAMFISTAVQRGRNIPGDGDKAGQALGSKAAAGGAHPAVRKDGLWGWQLLSAGWERLVQQTPLGIYHKEGLRQSPQKSGGGFGQTAFDVASGVLGKHLFIPAGISLPFLSKQETPEQYSSVCVPVRALFPSNPHVLASCMWCSVAWSVLATSSILSFLAFQKFSHNVLPIPQLLC